MCLYNTSIHVYVVECIEIPAHVRPPPSLISMHTYHMLPPCTYTFLFAVQNNRDDRVLTPKRVDVATDLSGSRAGDTGSVGYRCLSVTYAPFMQKDESCVDVCRLTYVSKIRAFTSASLPTRRNRQGEIK